MPTSYAEPSSTRPPPSPPPAAPSKWGPYSNSGDFGANVVIILVILFCALALVLALNAVIRSLFSSLRRRRRRGRSSDPSDPEKQLPDKKTPSPASASSSSLIFSASTKLAGAGAECSICLTEFVEGDGVSVLPACNHGFHTGCVEKWIASRESCPTCRTSCSVV